MPPGAAVARLPRPAADRGGRHGRAMAGRCGVTAGGEDDTGAVAPEATAVAAAAADVAHKGRRGGGDGMGGGGGGGGDDDDDGGRKEPPPAAVLDGLVDGCAVTPTALAPPSPPPLPPSPLPPPLDGASTLTAASGGQRPWADAAPDGSGDGSTLAGGVDRIPPPPRFNGVGADAVTDGASGGGAVPAPGAAAGGSPPHKTAPVATATAGGWTGGDSDGGDADTAAVDADAAGATGAGDDAAAYAATDAATPSMAASDAGATTVGGASVESVAQPDGRAWAGGVMGFHDNPAGGAVGSVAVAADAAAADTGTTPASEGDGMICGAAAAADVDGTTPAAAGDGCDGTGGSDGDGGGVGDGGGDDDGGSDGGDSSDGGDGGDGVDSRDGGADALIVAAGPYAAATATAGSLSPAGGGGEEDEIAPLPAGVAACGIPPPTPPRSYRAGAGAVAGAAARRATHQQLRRASAAAAASTATVSGARGGRPPLGAGAGDRHRPNGRPSTNLSVGVASVAAGVTAVDPTAVTDDAVSLAGDELRVEVAVSAGDAEYHLVGVAEAAAMPPATAATSTGGPSPLVASRASTCDGVEEDVAAGSPDSSRDGSLDSSGNSSPDSNGSLNVSSEGSPDGHSGATGGSHCPPPTPFISPVTDFASAPPLAMLPPPVVASPPHPLPPTSAFAPASGALVPDGAVGAPSSAEGSSPPTSAPPPPPLLRSARRRVQWAPTVATVSTIENRAQLAAMWDDSPAAAEMPAALRRVAYAPAPGGLGVTAGGPGFGAAWGGGGLLHLSPPLLLRAVLLALALWAVVSVWALRTLVLDGRGWGRGASVGGAAGLVKGDRGDSGGVAAPPFMASGSGDAEGRCALLSPPAMVSWPVCDAVGGDLDDGASSAASSAAAARGGGGGSPPLAAAAGGGPPAVPRAGWPRLSRRPRRPRGAP